MGGSYVIRVVVASVKLVTWAAWAAWVAFVAWVAWANLETEWGERVAWEKLVTAWAEWVAWAASVKLVPMASFASLMARSASSALVASTA